MGKCSICGVEITEGSMCPECVGGFSSNMVNCKICGKLGNDNICTACMSEYHPQIKAYLNQYPNMSYLEAVGSKNIPVPRRVFYEFVQAGLIKIKP